MVWVEDVNDPQGLNDVAQMPQRASVCSWLPDDERWLSLNYKNLGPYKIIRAINKGRSVEGADMESCGGAYSL